MKSILVDTGVWYAIFDPRDPNAEGGLRLAATIDKHRVVVPWPTMYETLRTRFVKNTLALHRFELFLKSHRNIAFVDDSQYRDDSFKSVFDSSIRDKRPISMADWLLRLIIDDANARISYLATFNVKDFHDVCVRRNIQIV